MKEGCCEVSWLFAYRIPERSWGVNLCPLQQQWLQPPPKATSPVVEKSTSTSNVLLFLLYYHEKPCPNTQPTCYSYSSGTWRTAFLFAATFHVFKDCYQNLNFFTTFPLYLHYAKQFYFIQHLLAGSVSWIYDCLYFYLFLSHFCYTL